MISFAKAQAIVLAITNTFAKVNYIIYFTKLKDYNLAFINIVSARYG